ncbi:hypothetical protein JOC24_003948 [Streptomyces sp. HB132]|nr:hypothetical protein [Streptomyces sp. HB132]
MPLAPTEAHTPSVSGTGRSTVMPFEGVADRAPGN